MRWLIKQHTNRLEFGEPRWRALVRLLIWLSVVAAYYVGIVLMEASEPSRINHGVWRWVFLSFPLFLTPYLIGITRGIRKSRLFVFDGVTGDLRKNGTPIVRFDQITGVRLKSVNGTCEELRLTVVGEDNFNIELPVDGTPGRVTQLAHSIAAITGVKARFI